jgi:DNA topoisomerase VI subunit A
MQGNSQPDAGTIELLRVIADKFPTAAILGFFDAAPDGVRLASAYKYGIKNKKYAADAQGCDRFEWIGLFIEDCYK